MIQSVIQILIADSAFKTAVGFNKAGNRYKVYPIVADQDEEPPYCVAFISSGVPISKDPNGSDQLTVEVVMCAKPGNIGAYEKIDDLAEKARAALEAHSGLESTGGYTLSLDVSNIRDGYDKDAGVMQRITTYSVIIER